MELPSAPPTALELQPVPSEHVDEWPLPVCVYDAPCCQGAAAISSCCRGAAAIAPCSGTAADVGKNVRTTSSETTPPQLVCNGGHSVAPPPSLCQGFGL
ncbi:hypothetical protein DPEC_G00110180 [Dallia pectoralis]|uniref:Uncharacterized protein n=1 Tax=Dallia pectoralis TaxID=75939 RepID=A0ACC2GSR2_DALPE|nr:hypothetical protein DPEC_G00110180 [Dallia pectoralis]